MFEWIALFVVLAALLGFLLWLCLRARKGRISVTTPLGANYELFTKDQRKAAEVIANRGASKKMEEQSSSDPE